jgi:methylisocitrate lyase
MVTLDGFTKIIKEVAFSSGLPIIADADTGFGEGEMCAKTVWEYFLSGASGNIKKNLKFLRASH